MDFLLAEPVFKALMSIIVGAFFILGSVLIFPAKIDVLEKRNMRNIRLTSGIIMVVLAIVICLIPKYLH